eukprot:CAMPEP_0172740236 /NCGR_PEP_ID=MMETSP1074-20121228/124451_1 /TAXON_ID=2916 /ORGANISM="Ceratium fusus, Strain PA161109" /LENGTH=138 /DNA_ID=CAMNT_0013570313 /DNA_START=170 /DNA_END=583 /DNA_ORIENTATION=-
MLLAMSTAATCARGSLKGCKGSSWASDMRRIMIEEPINVIRILEESKSKYLNASLFGLACAPGVRGAKKRIDAGRFSTSVTMSCGCVSGMDRTAGHGNWAMSPLNRARMNPDSSANPAAGPSWVIMVTDPGFARVTLL